MIQSALIGVMLLTGALQEHPRILLAPFLQDKSNDPSCDQKGRVQPDAKLLENRTKDKKMAWVIRGGGGEDTEKGVLAALRWLSRHQGADGAWHVQDYLKECGKTPTYGSGKCTPNPGHDDFDSGITALSLLAFLGAGYTYKSPDSYDDIAFGNVVRKSLQWMMRHQDPDGCIGSREAQKYMYTHALWTLALCEVYAMAPSDMFKGHVEKAVAFLVAAQNPGKGWRYSHRSGENDSSVTYWAAMALMVARHAKLKVPESAFTGAQSWFDEMTGDNGLVGYTRKGHTGWLFIPGASDNFDDHPTLTAGAGVFRALTGDQRQLKGLSLLEKDPPQWKGMALDFIYWNLGSLALFHHEGPNSAAWKAWNAQVKKLLLEKQVMEKGLCKSGSWNAVDRWSRDGGRVYATAINAITLETYYRYKRAADERK